MATLNKKTHFWGKNQLQKGGFRNVFFNKKWFETSPFRRRETWPTIKLWSCPFLIWNGLEIEHFYVIFNLGHFTLLSQLSLASSNNFCFVSSLMILKHPLTINIYHFPKQVDVGLIANILNLTLPAQNMVANRLKFYKIPGRNQELLS